MHLYAICYINKNKQVFKVSSCLKEFIYPFKKINEKQKDIEPMLEITLCNSFQEAKEQYDFIKL